MKNFTSYTNMRLVYIFLFLPIFLASSCSKERGTDTLKPNVEQGGSSISQVTTVRLVPVDRYATLETEALYNNLKKVAKTNCLFGHQEDTKTGYGWENVYNSEDTAASLTVDSDVQKITGVRPAVYGWDFSNIVNFYTGDKMAYERRVIRQLAIEAYNRGGVNTFSWHYHNPVAKEGIWWNQAPVPAVTAILPGGSHHDVYKQSLRELAAYAHSLVGADGKEIPVIFRPFHEMNGDWFWWGKGHCTVSEYKQLYQFTVKYLRDSLSVHNFLYAWSPDRAFSNEQQYLEYYPGDQYVDILGMDNYYDLSPGVDPSIAAGKLKIVSDYVVRKKKVAAFTETGLNTLPVDNWFMGNLLPALKRNAPELAYVMLWSNTTDMFWTPFLGHPGVNDFLDFRSQPYMLFSDRTPPMYKVN
jgi:mannan endo-1,4-beta-mannosidase